jgi:hypothetical protein
MTRVRLEVDLEAGKPLMTSLERWSLAIDTDGRALNAKLVLVTEGGPRRGTLDSKAYAYGEASSTKTSFSLCGPEFGTLNGQDVLEIVYDDYVGL